MLRFLLCFLPAMTFRKIGLALALLTGLSSFHDSYATTQEAIDQDIASLLANAPAEALGFDSREVGFSTEDQELYAVYHENGLSALWVTPAGPGDSAKALYEAINNAAEEGLNKDDYHFSTLTRYWNSSDSLELSRLDILVTLALVAWVNDVTVGRVHPRVKHPELFARAGERRGDPVVIVQNFQGIHRPPPISSKPPAPAPPLPGTQEIARPLPGTTAKRRLATRARGRHLTSG